MSPPDGATSNDGARPDTPRDDRREPGPEPVGKGGDGGPDGGHGKPDDIPAARDDGDDDGLDSPERPHGHTPTDADRVEVDEPLLAARVHRPSDLVRLLVGILGIAIVLGISAFAHGTTHAASNRTSPTAPARRPTY